MDPQKLKEIEDQMKEFEGQSEEDIFQKVLEKMEITPSDLAMLNECVELAYSPADRECLLKAGKTIISSTLKAESLLKHKLHINHADDLPESKCTILSLLISQKGWALQNDALKL